MTAQNTGKVAKYQNLTRRRFLRTSCMAVSGVGLGARAQKLLAEEITKPIDMPNIDPGYIGPQFFDKQE